MYNFKNFKFYQLGGTKSKYYSCSVGVDVANDILKDISELDDKDIYALKLDIRDDIIDDFNTLLNQNNIKFTVSKYNPMDLSLGGNYYDGYRVEPKIHWESPINATNTENLQKLQEIIN